MNKLWHLFGVIFLVILISSCKVSVDDNGELQVDTNEASTSDSADGASTEDDAPETTSSETVDGPKVVSAGSTSNTEVRVLYSKPMDDSAADPSNYSIVQENVNSEAAGLTVIGGRFASDDRRSVLLTTLSQSAVTYTLNAFNVRDVDGNPPPPPGTFAEVYINPTEVSFAGTPAGGASLVDTDGDGLTDDAEQNGWISTVTLSSGEQVSTEVTSDPNSPDTDLDGVSDQDEQQRGLNPRSTDTDSDDVPDADEINIYYSNAAKQNSDSDGLSDGAEIYTYKTSPIDPDTDGDGQSDSDEVIQRSRNPRIADLPIPGITVDSITPELDIRYTLTDSTGFETSTEDSVGTSLSQSTSQNLSRTDGRTTETTNSAEASLEVSSTIGLGGLAGPSVTVGAKYGYSNSQGQNMQVSRESAKSATEEMNRSLTTNETLDIEYSVVRTVEAASVLAEVSLRNLSDLSYSIRDLELSLRRRNPDLSSGYLPVASMVPQNNEELIINLGPLGSVAERGPFIFESKTVFPSRVEELLKDPTSIAIALANYNIIDEFGRKFSFAAQEIADRTAGIVIDYGDGRVERYRVATTNGFVNGFPKGITLGEALQDIIGLKNDDAIVDGGNGIAESTAAGDDVQVLAPLVNTQGPGALIISPGPNGVLDTVPDGDDRIGGTGYDQQITNTPDGPVATITRFKDVGIIRVDDPTTTFNESLNLWGVFLGESLSGQPIKASINDLRLRAGDVLSIAYFRDEDNDGLIARNEYQYGSSDKEVDTDQDSLGDFEEVMEGWLVHVLGDAGTYRAFSDPVRVDSDGDLLSDDLEKACGTDPRLNDSDLDGITDYDEIIGYSVLNQSGQVLYRLPYYRGKAIADGGNGLNESSYDNGSDDVLLGASEGGILIAPGPDGQLQSTPGGDDIETAFHATDTDCIVPIKDGAGNVVDHARGYATDPLNPDTDGDGFTDGAEARFGKNPNSRADGLLLQDTDQDGLPDGIEDHPDGGQGFTILINGVETTVVSSYTTADSDNDGLPDLLEFYLLSNPGSNDTDGDGLLDGEEFDPNDTCISIQGQSGCATNAFDRQSFETACAEAANCAVDLNDFPDNSGAGSPRGTNLSHRDSDGDGLNDGDEVFGVQLPTILHATEGSKTITVTSNPRLADTDNDGVNDGQEVNVHGSDPGETDTDGDQVPDGTEVNSADLADNVPEVDGRPGHPDYNLFPMEARKRSPARAEHHIRAIWDRWNVGNNDCNEDYFGYSVKVTADINTASGNDTRTLSLRSITYTDEREVKENQNLHPDFGAILGNGWTDLELYLPYGSSISFGAFIDSDGEVLNIPSGYCAYSFADIDNASGTITCTDPVANQNACFNDDQPQVRIIKYSQ